MRLVERRKAKGWTQKKVADKVGVDQSQICNYEKGGYKPKYDTALALAELFGCTVGEIMAGCGPGTEDEP